jgi:hypothetical protein
VSQTDRVLALLRARGDRGVNLTDFSLPGVVDGGKPITRLAARIIELRDRGFFISRTMDANGTARYTLDSEPVELDRASACGEADAGTRRSVESGLFDGAAFGEPGWKDVA